MNKLENSNTAPAPRIFDMIVPPFFKRLGDCTGRELGIAAAWLTEYAKTKHQDNADDREAV